jgi:AcrR family transcriptional regulator
MSVDQKQRIIAGAEELFFRAGIRSVTMDDIARHFGMSKKTLYQFFKDKNDLVNTLVKEKISEDCDHMCDIGTGAENAFEALVKMLNYHEEFFGKINPIVIHDLKKYHPEAWNELQSFKSEVVSKAMEDILQRGIEEGDIRPDVDPLIMARLRIYQVELGFDQRIYPLSSFNTWKVQLQLLEHFIYGVASDKGRQTLERYRNQIEK